MGVSEGPTSPLGRVLRAVVSGQVATSWEDAAEGIEDERRAVLAEIEAEGARPVYGFTTLLGPLDGISAQELTPGEVLAGHLVGIPRPVPQFWWDLIHAVRLEHLSLGGSGVSRETYDAVTESFGVHRGAADRQLDLGASYGSGDVVPASWWITAVLGEAPRPAGDLIALMNGSFVSVGTTIGALLRLELVLPEAVAVLVGRGKVQPDLAPSADQALMSQLASLQSARAASVQLPVSLRDVGAWLLPLLECVTRVEGALDDRLGRRSANPQFLIDGNAVKVSSQSSFLSLDLRFALDSLLSAVVMTGGLLQRTMESHFDADGVGTSVSDMKLIQPTKVVHAIYMEMLTLVTPYGFVGAMSGGVEDLWDGVLLRAQQLDRMVTLLQKQLHVIEAVVGSAGNTTTVRRVLSSRLRGLAAVPSGLVLHSLQQEEGC